MAEPTTLSHSTIITVCGMGPGIDRTGEIRVALEKNGLTILFPQHDLHLKNSALAAAPE